jgi:putative sterol carrier protein
VTEFLSDDWFDTLEARASRAVVPAGIDLTLHQTVGRDPAISWQIHIGAGAVKIERGAAEEADVHLASDLHTALGIHRGEISAQRAFLDGRLRIDGDIATLMTHREVLEALTPLLGIT